MNDKRERLGNGLSSMVHGLKGFIRFYFRLLDQSLADLNIVIS
jgi:hypothetical protein